MARSFADRGSFAGDPPNDWHLLPFSHIGLDAQREVLVNIAGEYVVAPRGTTRRLVRREMDSGTSLFADLRAKHFVHDQRSSPLLDVLATKYRTKKAFLEGFTKLHIFVVTLRCEHSCSYCQVSRQSADRVRFDMSQETADRSLDLMFQSEAQNLTLEFQGGEPLLNFALIQYIVPRARARAASVGRKLDIVITTNLALATDEILQYCREHRLLLSTSLDGPSFIHDANRPRPGNNSHALVVDAVRRARQIVGTANVAALMTTTRLSLEHPKEIIDEYVRLGFRSVFLRALSPYGFATRSASKTGYATERYLDFYRVGLAHIIDLNMRGIDIAEVYATTILRKILTPFPTFYVDLQSPAGAGIGAVVYNYDGDVYASDEGRMLAEMGDKTFRLGNVHADDHAQIFGGPHLKNIIRESTAEALPGCNECAFLPYCGSDPVFNYRTQGDVVGHRPTSGFCQRNMEIIRCLFKLLADGGPAVERIVYAWVRGKSVRDVGLPTEGAA